jgi:hypothetical protein
MRTSLIANETTGIVVHVEHPEIGVLKDWRDLSDEVPDDDTFTYEGEWTRAEEFSRRYPPDWYPE